MATFNNIDFTNLVTFNGATVPKAPGAAELTAWDPTPAGANDGDYYQVSGTSTVYRYDSTLGFLVRPEIYDFSGTKVLDETIAGSENGAGLTSAGWYVSTEGNVTTSGGWTIIDSTSTATSASVQAGSTANGMYFAGYLSHSAGPSSNYEGSNSISSCNGNFRYTFSTKKTTASNDPGFIKTTGTETDGDIKLEQVDDFNLASTGGKWVEFYVISGSTTDEQAFAWIGHSESPVRFCYDAIANSGLNWVIGSCDTKTGGEIFIKECYFARLV
jgi:hypothetical protein